MPKQIAIGIQSFEELIKGECYYVDKTNFSLINNYTVFENVELPLIPKGIKKSERKKIVNEQLELLGIKDLEKKYSTKICYCKSVSFWE